jgi:hypothetical protein
MFLVRPGAYPRVEQLKGASLGLAPALPANIKLDWIGFPGTNTLAYYENSLITNKKFFNIGLLTRCYKTFLTEINSLQ